MVSTSLDWLLVRITIGLIELKVWLTVSADRVALSGETRVARWYAVARLLEVLVVVIVFTVRCVVATPRRTRGARRDRRRSGVFELMRGTGGGGGALAQQLTRIEAVESVVELDGRCRNARHRTRVVARFLGRFDAQRRSDVEPAGAAVVQRRRRRRRLALVVRRQVHARRVEHSVHLVTDWPTNRWCGSLSVRRVIQLMALLCGAATTAAAVDASRPPVNDTRNGTKTGRRAVFFDAGLQHLGPVAMATPITGARRVATATLPRFWPHTLVMNASAAALPRQHSCSFFFLNRHRSPFVSTSPTVVQSPSCCAGDGHAQPPSDASIRYETTSRDYGRYSQLTSTTSNPSADTNHQGQRRRQLGPKFSQVQAAVGMYRNSCLNWPTSLLCYADLDGLHHWCPSSSVREKKTVRVRLPYWMWNQLRATKINSILSLRLPLVN